MVRAIHRYIFFCMIILGNLSVTASEDNKSLTQKKCDRFINRIGVATVCGFLFTAYVSHSSGYQKAAIFENEKIVKNCIDLPHISNEKFCRFLKEHQLFAPWYAAHNLDSMKKIDFKAEKCSENLVFESKVINRQNDYRNWAISDESYYYLSDEKIKAIQNRYVDSSVLENCLYEQKENKKNLRSEKPIQQNK